VRKTDPRKEKLFIYKKERKKLTEVKVLSPSTLGFYC
jgi:hypothetical protein